MSLLNSVSSGKQVKAMIHTIFGLPGVGKTSWAAQFPKCLIIDLEKGSHHLDVDRLDNIDSLDAFRSLIDELVISDHKYQTIAVDSIESLELLICDWVCKEGGVETIEKYEGGYGKGYQRSREIMREIMGSLRKLTDKDITVILVGHSQVKTHNDPAENTSFDRHVMRVNDKMGAVIRDLSDNVFFACHKVNTYKDQGKVRAISDGERVLRTEWRASFDAKSRMNLPFEIPLSYHAFIAASESNKPKSLEDLRSEVEQMIAGLDAETKPKAQTALDKAKTIEELISIKNRISTIINA